MPGHFHLLIWPRKLDNPRRIISSEAADCSLRGCTRFGGDAQIPAIAEPWLLAFNASIECQPVMVPDDLAKANRAIEAAVNKYR